MYTLKIQIALILCPCSQKSMDSDMELKAPLPVSKIVETIFSEKLFAKLQGQSDPWHPLMQSKS